MTKSWSYRKCPCGHAGCNQYTISEQGSVGFTKEDAQLICAAPNLRDTLKDIASGILPSKYPMDHAGLARYHVDIAKAALIAIDALKDTK